MLSAVLPCRVSAPVFPPFSDCKRDDGDCGTWLRPVGFSTMDNTSEAAGLMPLAGGWLGFTHLDLLQQQGERYTVCRLAPQQLLDAAALAGPAAAETCHAALRQLTIRRPDFAGLSMEKPHIMGILNATPDSFSDGGVHYHAAHAISAGQTMLQQGASILDIGGESTRPGAEPVSRQEESRRIMPVISELADTGAVISADTRHAETMQLALEAGAMVINDVGGLRGHGVLQVLEEAQASAVIMHMQGEPGTMQDNPQYGFAPAEIYDWLAGRLDAAVAAGIPRHRLAVDPGIGFGKTVRHNMQLMAWLSLFHGLGVPVLLGASRKSTIGRLSCGEPAAERLPGSLSLATMAVAQGVQLVRVHDVAETAQSLAVTSALLAEC